MIVTVKAIYKKGRLIFYDSAEIPEDGTDVIVNYEKRPQISASSLRNSWTEYFPPDIDLEAELKNIRREWEQEMEEISERSLD